MREAEPIEGVQEPRQIAPRQHLGTAAVHARAVPHGCRTPHERLASIGRDGDALVIRELADVLAHGVEAGMILGSADEIVGASVLWRGSEALDKGRNDLVVRAQGLPDAAVDCAHRDVSDEIEIADPNILEGNDRQPPPDAGAAMAVERQRRVSGAFRIATPDGLLQERCGKPGIEWNGFIAFVHSDLLSGGRSKPSDPGLTLAWSLTRPKEKALVAEREIPCTSPRSLFRKPLKFSIPRQAASAMSPASHACRKSSPGDMA